tara:strand:- start:42 stop:623 length:582 start_codon:yes stop_codon:yes gene_type:complete
MLNFYRNHSFTRPIEQWSIRLNHLQSKKKYSNIQKLIVKIISLYAIDLMRTCDTYNAGILETNIKRFNRICKGIDSLEGFSMELINYNDNIVFLLFDIFRSIIKNDGLDVLKPLFVQVELYLLYEDYTPLIEYAMNNNKLNILDKLFKYSQLIYRFALDLYNIPLNTPGVYQTRNGIMSGKKFVEIVKEYSEI